MSCILTACFIAWSQLDFCCEGTFAILILLRCYSSQRIGSTQIDGAADSSFVR